MTTPKGKVIIIIAEEERTLKSKHNNVSTPPVEIKDLKPLMGKHYYELTVVQVIVLVIVLSKINKGNRENTIFTSIENDNLSDITVTSGEYPGDELPQNIEPDKPQELLHNR
ncbi:hypothetical protein FQA39_LY05254 [Lamprigera yunnana]|nr:hypothetical protein FQA39_LY05254 [Lamprigera yunnana]